MLRAAFFVSAARTSPMLALLRRIPDRLWRLVITPYRPDSATRAFMERAQQQEDSHATATVAVLTPAESRAPR